MYAVKGGDEARVKRFMSYRNWETEINTSDNRPAGLRERVWAASMKLKSSQTF